VLFGRAWIRAHNRSARLDVGLTEVVADDSSGSLAVWVFPAAYDNLRFEHADRGHPSHWKGLEVGDDPSSGRFVFLVSRLILMLTVSRA
jgi:hypothetical protein